MKTKTPNVRVGDCAREPHELGPAAARREIDIPTTYVLGNLR